MNYVDLIPLERELAVPLYQQVANGIIDAARKGVLPLGHKMPGAGRLATLLGLHKRTVEQAYDELNAEGWVEAVPYSGTYIAACLPITKAQSLEGIISQFPAHAAFDFARFSFKKEVSPYFTGRPWAEIAYDDGNPDISQMAAVTLDKYYRALLERKRPNVVVNKMSPWGSKDLRNNLCLYLNNTRGLRSKIDNIMIAKGNQLSIYMVLALLIKKGDEFAFAETNYKGISDIVQYLGGEINTIPSDKDGLMIDKLEEICRQKQVRVVYVMSHSHYPSTEKLSKQRRIDLLNLAHRYNFVIVEDDFDFDYHYSNSPILPIASADTQGRVIYVGGLNRSISSAVRVSYIIGPTDFLKELVKFKAIIDKFTDPILEEALAQLIKNTEFVSYLRKATKYYKSKRDYICSLINNRLQPYCRVSVPEGGLAVWVILNQQIDIDKFTNLCLNAGLSLPFSEELYVKPVHINGFRLGFSSISKQHILKSICIMEEVLHKHFKYISGTQLTTVP